MRRDILLYGIVFVGLMIICSAMTCVAEVTIGTITLDPAEPAPLSTITFSAEVTGDDIMSVYLNVKECNENIGVCETFPTYVLMENIEGNIYQARDILNFTTATYITYSVHVLSNGIWENTSDIRLNLAETPSNGNGSTNGNGDKSPGFELVFFIAAVAVGILLLRRKRSR